MSNIQEDLAKILSSRYGRDVRQSIHDAIEDCYEDGRASAIATTETAGLVKPDGATITIDSDGTIHSIGGGGGGGTTNYNLLSNKPKINNKELTGNVTLSEIGAQPSGTYITPSDVATVNNAGLVKPDGTTISVTADGTITAIATASATESPITSATGNINAITLYGESRKSKNLLESIVQGSWEDDGTPSPSSSSNYGIRCRFSNKVACAKNDSFVFSSSTNKYEIYARVFDASGTLLERFGWAKTFTVTNNNASYCLVTIRDDNNANITPSSIVNGQFEKGTSATSYEPYGIISADGEVECSSNGQTSSINASTICPNYSLYGIDTIKNTLEVYADGSGKFVSKIGSVNLGSLSWTYYSDFGFRTNNYPEGIKAGVNSVVSNILCTKYIADTATNIINSVKEKTIGIGAQKYVFVCDKSYTDATTFKTSLNGVKLIYELATPTETPLTAEEVAQFLALKTFKGTTNISADCGYKISHYLDNNVAQGIANVGTRTETNTLDIADTKAMISDAWSSSKTYAQGEFCIYNNALWKSKVSSNTGNTPTESSYWTETSVGDEVLKYATLSITTATNSDVSPFSCWGRNTFNLGNIKTLRVDTPTNVSLAVAYTDKGCPEYINVVSNKTGTYDVVVGYV